ncbi:DUF1289 domain-containing protein [Sphingomonas sp. NBWT7]|uniref:DUF1289 domain-containing protein n=1 Tax=Sphingomonas sp. NBWT7 TaxID=2596913 RepID=UPI001623E183|nr:DUF1289 domain-containing protein [Sphingomonas sp. NBWT7]QNE32508.1 DUF1289 domain-containing protein [Sphingomonas sp. NBWT7]
MSKGIRSPCVRVCRPDVAGGPCSGCLRTRAEIVGWARMSEDEQQAIVDDIPRRMRERFAARRMGR